MSSMIINANHIYQQQICLGNFGVNWEKTIQNHIDTLINCRPTLNKKGYNISSLDKGKQEIRFLSSELLNGKVIDLIN